MASPTSPAAQSVPQSTVKQSVFEGLFVHVLEVPSEGPLADALRRVGYDLKRQEAEYSGQVWQQALGVACQRLHPELTAAEAKRGLGKRFIEGFLKTLAGRALGVVLPMTGVEGALRRLPRFLSMGAPAMRATTHEEQPRSWRVEVDVPWAQADFDAGLIEAGLGRTGAPVQVSVLERAEHRYVLRVSW